MLYRINKGVGQPLDFFGLKGRYILFFAVGMSMAFVSYFVARLIGEVVGFVTAGVVAVFTYVLCYHLNKKYGLNGIGDRIAMSVCPQRVSPKKAKRLILVTSRKK